MVPQIDLFIFLYHTQELEITFANKIRFKTSIKAFVQYVLSLKNNLGKTARGQVAQFVTRYKRGDIDMVVEICRNYDRLHGTQTQATVEVREVPPPAPAVVDPRFPQVPLVEVQPSAPSLSPEQQKVFDLIQQLNQQMADSGKLVGELLAQQKETIALEKAGAKRLKKLSARQDKTIALEKANTEQRKCVLAMLGVNPLGLQQELPQQKPQAALPTV